MKKIKNTLAVVILLVSTAVFSQSSLPKGKTQLNLGAGFSNWGVPFYIGLDHSVHNDVTLGGEFSYRSYRENWKKIITTIM